MDAYQQAVEYLTAHPGRIYSAWQNPFGSIGGCLFVPVKRRPWTPSPCYYGCIIEVRAGYFDAETEELTVAIRADERLPDNPCRLGNVDLLPVCAQWGRWIDRVLNRTPPRLIRIPPPKGDIEIRELVLHEVTSG